jgi:uncharacterized hydrophobic protein (TIGR00271 family)
MRQLLVIRRILDYINLESELDDHERIHQTIEKDIIFKGTNLWILSFAIIVASVGLNMNSTAVIIGAMLISPLMGPINGMGYSIATYNFPLFRKSVKNLSFAVIAGLLASTMYFAITPISTAHSELLARTSPTIYDVLIALFGGLAGIVAISSRQKGNVIPGVAIATALMPPLCTSGYGLATGQFQYFFGAFYLFTINTVFIALSSVVISQILRFPIRTLVDPVQKKRINQLISMVIAIVLIPSIYFGYLLVQKERFFENANSYVRNISIIEGNFLLRNDIDPHKRAIQLVFGGPSLSEEQKRRIRDKAADFNLQEAEITFQQGISFDDISRSSEEVGDLKDEINRLRLQVEFQERALDSLTDRSRMGGQLVAEMQALFPFVEDCLYARSGVYSSEEVMSGQKDIVVITVSRSEIAPDEKARLREWLRARLKSRSLRVFFESGSAG